MVSPKEEGMRYSSERNQCDRYSYEERSIHYYREVRDDREMMNSNNGSNNITRHSQEPPEFDKGNFHNTL